MLQSSLWIDLRADHHNAFVEEHLHAYHDFRKLQFPDDQSPQMIMLIGASSKAETLRKLYPSFNSDASHNKVHLHLLPCSVARSPILIADCELHNSPLTKNFVDSKVTSSVIERKLLWQRSANCPDIRILAHLVYSKLIAPFSTIICFFADDLGGIGAVTQILAAWLLSRRNRISDLPASTYPRVLILIRDEGSAFDEERTTRTFMKELVRVANQSLGQKSNGRRLTDERFKSLIKQQFGGLRVLAVPNPTTARYCPQRLERRWESLTKKIIQGSRQIQGRRRKAQVAFSANHFQAFFRLARDHFARDIVTPFSFVKASRLANPVPEEFSFHIANFLKDVKSAELESFVYPLIASALTLDNYAPEMHVFPPAQVFDNFYHTVLLDVPIDKEKIKGLFCQQATSNVDELVETSITHRAVLSQFPDIWKSTFSKTTCYLCIARNPEDNILDCGHSFCDPCVVRHSHAMLEEPSKYIIHVCPLCGTPNKVTFSQKPYTAGGRCLMLSGPLGDVFGAECLKEIELRLGLPGMRIQEYFDIAFGTGSGALTLVGLFCKGISIDECIALSKTLVHARSLRGCFSSTSNQYSSTRINYTLKKALGSKEPLFRRSKYNSKVAIVATAVQNSSTHIFPNYNGPTQRLSTCFRLEKLNLLWQAARAGSADPPDFKSFHGYQSLEDQSTLTSIASWEQDFVWSRKNKRPDVFLSLGARTEVISTIENDPHLRGHSLEAWMSFCTDSILASLFYIELVGRPLLDKIGFVCRLNIQCRLLPSEPHLKTLVKRLHDSQARFYYDFQKSLPCVDQEVFEEVKNGVAFSRCIEVTVLSLNDEVDVKIDGIIKRGRSISNCPYIINDIMEDQGLNCWFGHKDHKRRYRGIARDMPIRQRYI